MATFDLGRVTPLYKGDYSASTSYELNDVVLCNGNLYWHVQATATVGIAPTDTTVWKLAFSDEGVRAEIRGYADNAQASADSASASASQAALSAQTASTKASEASTSAQTASTKASEASASAAVSAQTATAKASEAAASATSAQEYDESSHQNAVNAQGSATAAAASEAQAQHYAENASAYLMTNTEATDLLNLAKGEA